MKKYFLLSPLLLLSLFGCVKHGERGAPSQALAKFPSREELASAPSKPLPPTVFIENAVRVEQWDIDPATIPAPGAEPEEAIKGALRELFGDRSRPSAALSCAAREVGKVHLARGGTPGEGLRQYAAGRCGASLPSVNFSSFEARVPEKTPDAELWKMATEGFKKAGPQKIPDGVTLEAGAALVRQGDRALFVMAGGQNKAKLDPVAPVPQGRNEVILRGSLGEAAEAIHGIINQGTHGFASCRSEPVAPPGFALRCPMGRGDGSAWIDVIARPPKKLLSRSALRVLATREGARAPYAPAALPSRAKGEFAPALVANLNAVRAQGKLSPLRVSTEQAALNERHAGSILGGLEDEKSDRLALGLMAGWDVQGMIRRGNLLALVSSSTGDPGEWLSEALDMPLARSILLEPDQRVIAVGAASAAGRGGIGAVITTYALFESNEHAAEVAQVIDQLNATRARRGLAPATLLRDLAPLDAAAARVFKDEQGVEEALQAALNEASGQLNRPAQGAYFEAIDLDALEFPEPLLAPQPPTVAIAVTHHKAPGAAWGQYVVLLVALPGGGQQQARAAAPARL